MLVSSEVVCNVVLGAGRCWILNLFRSVCTPGKCIDIKYMDAQRLLVVCPSQILTFKGPTRLQCKKFATSITSVVCYGGYMYYVSTRNQAAATVFKSSCSFENNEELFTYETESPNSTRLAVSRQYMAVIGASNNSITTVRRKNGGWSDQRHHFLLVKKPMGVHFYSDGDVLVSNNEVAGSLSRYRLSQSEPQLIWTCTKLIMPSCICTDESGHIFVSSSRQRAIFLISPTGRL